MTNLLLLPDDGSIVVVIPLILAFIALYLWMCYEVGKYAKKKGRGFWLFFVICLIVNPIIGYIIAALIGENDAVRQEQIRREVKNALEQERNNKQTQDNQDIQGYQEIEDNQE